MTRHDINRLLSADGFYVIGSRNHPPTFSQPVAVLCRIPHRLLVGCELSSDPRDWHGETYLAGGPYTIRSIADLDQMAADVEERFLMLSHDRDFWRDMVRRMEPFVSRAAKDDEMEAPDRAYAKAALADFREAEEVEKLQREKS